MNVKCTFHIINPPVIEQLEDADDLQLRDESDLVIMKEDVVNLLRHLVEKVWDQEQSLIV